MPCPLVLLLAATVVLGLPVAWGLPDARAGAQEAGTAGEPAVPPGARGVWTLADAVHRALRDNPGLAARRLGTHLAMQDLREAEAAYDPRFTGDAGYRRDESDQTVPIFGTSQKTGTASAGVEWQAPWGSRLGFSLGTRRYETDSTFATSATTYTSTASLGLTQPLTRDAWGGATRARLDASRSQVMESILSVEDAEEALVMEVSSAWWDLLAAQEQQTLAARALEQARVFLEAVRDKRSLGTAEEVDLLAADADVSRRASEQLEAEYRTELAGRRLGLLLGLREPLRAAGTFPESVDPPAPEAVDPDERRDLAALRARLDALEARVRWARSERRAGWDLVLDWSMNGVDPDLSDAFSEALGADHPSWFVGLRWNDSLERKRADATLTRSRLERERLLAELQAASDRAVFELEDARRRVEVLVLRLDMAADQVTLARAKRDEERRNFDAGRSGSDRLLRFEDELIGAERARVEVAAALQRTLAGRRRAENRLLGDWFPGGGR